MTKAMQSGLKAQGRWFVECHNPDRSLAWREDVTNAINTTALNDLCSVYFAGGTQKTTWFIGLIDSAGFSALTSLDTMASHTGWTESVAYADATRPAWTPGPPAAGSIINPTPATVTMNGPASIRGAFLASNSTKSGSAGLLWATGLFSSVQTVVNGQVMSLTYQCPFTPV